MEDGRQLRDKIRDHYVSLLPLYQRLKLAAVDAEWLALGLDSTVYAPAGCELPELAYKTCRTRPTGPAIFLKFAEAWKIKDVTHPVTNTLTSAQQLVGGPNALTTALVGGALGGLGGYGAGWIYDKTVPKSLRRMLPQQLWKDGPNLDEVLDPSGTHMASTLGMLGVAGGTGLGAFLGAHLYPKLNAPPQYTKAAADTGALFIPSIPVDAFNKVVWSNTLQAPNPFGTRNAFGDNDQEMFTPPHVANAIGGLVSAAGAARNSAYVSPWDVAQVAAHAGMNAGLGGLMGSATGLVAGKMLGALAGLTPAAQTTLQQSGLWAGILTGVAKSVF